MSAKMEDYMREIVKYATVAKYQLCWHERALCEPLVTPRFPLALLTFACGSETARGAKRVICGKSSSGGKFLNQSHEVRALALLMSHQFLLNTP